MDGPDAVSRCAHRRRRACVATEAAFWLVPGAVPDALTEALLGPAVTVVETPRANPPACAPADGGVGDLRPVALDGDIQIVLERQGDGVLQDRYRLPPRSSDSSRLELARLGRRHRRRPVGLVSLPSKPCDSRHGSGGPAVLERGWAHRRRQAPAGATSNAAQSRAR